MRRDHAVPARELLAGRAAGKAGTPARRSRAASARNRFRCPNGIRPEASTWAHKDPRLYGYYPRIDFDDLGHLRDKHGRRLEKHVEAEVEIK